MVTPDATFGGATALFDTWRMGFECWGRVLSAQADALSAAAGALPKAPEPPRSWYREPAPASAPALPLMPAWPNWPGQSASPLGFAAPMAPAMGAGDLGAMFEPFRAMTQLAGVFMAGAMTCAMLQRTFGGGDIRAAMPFMPAIASASEPIASYRSDSGFAVAQIEFIGPEVAKAATTAAGVIEAWRKAMMQTWLAALDPQSLPRG